MKWQQTPPLVFFVLFIVLSSKFNLYGTQNFINRTNSFPTRSTNLYSNHMLLTIAVDHGGSCPQRCTWIHRILPAWVRFRYIDFDDTSSLPPTSSEKTFPSNYLFVARREISALDQWAQKYRQKTNNSVGLFLMADELNSFKAESSFSNFDYVLRNYYFRDSMMEALGNMSCGSSPSSSPRSRKAITRLGVFWVFLQPFSHSGLLERPAKSVFPTMKRPQNCSFVGRATSQREEMKKAFMTHGADLECNIMFTPGYGKGNDDYSYVAHDLGQTKIGLHPPGNNPECHRLPELLTTGTVPALLDAPFLWATFRPIPAIVGKSWRDVIGLIQSLLLRPHDLERLSLDGSLFYEELRDCMMKDMDLILQEAFSKASNQRAEVSQGK